MASASFSPSIPAGSKGSRRPRWARAMGAARPGVAGCGGIPPFPAGEGAGSSAPRQVGPQTLPLPPRRRGRRRRPPDRPAPAPATPSRGGRPGRTRWPPSSARTSPGDASNSRRRRTAAARSPDRPGSNLDGQAEPVQQLGPQPLLRVHRAHQEEPAGMDVRHPLALHPVDPALATSRSRSTRWSGNRLISST